LDTRGQPTTRRLPSLGTLEGFPDPPATELRRRSRLRSIVAVPGNPRGFARRCCAPNSLRPGACRSPLVATIFLASTFDFLQRTTMSSTNGIPRKWTVADSAETYGIKYWSQNYF